MAKKKASAPKKRGRPPVDPQPKVNLTLVLPVSLHARLKADAASDGRSMNAQIIHLVRVHLDKKQ